MFEVEKLRVRYGSVEVVHGIDLQLAEGEVLGMVGPNGAGKSSIARALCGLVVPRGIIRFNGTEISGLAPEEIACLGLALVPEGRQIFKTLSVAENLRLGARSGESEASERVLERFPVLRERAAQRADRLSGGEQQQLALARALVGEPRLLIVDEPSLGLAPKMIDVIYELLADLRADGVTMLLIEQNFARTVAFCDRCVVLGGGLVRTDGTRAELERDRQVLGTYLGRQV